VKLETFDLAVPARPEVRLRYGDPSHNMQVDEGCAGWTRSRASYIGDGSWSRVSSTCAQRHNRGGACRGGQAWGLREYGKIANTPAALRTLAAKLESHRWRLRFCYEAGLCGYGIQRQLSEAGHECVVVAPSLIPRKPGDRVKTDRRDATNLAKLHRAGELSLVWVPDPAHEAIRDLVRTRLAAVRVLRQARQQLSGFLLRHGHHYNRPAWT
jgi:transposase